MSKFSILPILGALFISTHPSAWAAVNLGKTELTQKAQALMKQDKKLQAILKSDGSVLMHPRLVDHPQYQTLIYHQVHMERLDSRHFRQWEMIGGDVRFHYNAAKGHSFLSVDLVPMKDLGIFNKLMPEDQVPSKLAAEFQTQALIATEDYEIRHRLLPAEGRIVPVYWIKLKEHFIPGRSARIVVMDARSGEVLKNYSVIRLDEKTSTPNPMMPKIEVRNGGKNIAKTDLFGEDDDLSKHKSILKKYAHVCQLISTKKQSEGTPILVHPDKCDVVYDGQNFSHNVDEAGKSAFSNTKIILSFYGQHFQQWGLDFDPSLPGVKRMPIVSIVHIGENFDNAYYDEDLKVMVYGDGSGGNQKDSTHSYTQALDVAGHEYTHGIVAQTANFVGDGEAGAMNEGFADIFGLLIGRSDNPHGNWSIGKKLYNNADGDLDEMALRSISDPEKYKTSSLVNGQQVMVPFPKKYSQRLAIGQKCTDANDQCEVHANSTIWSHAAYLVDQKLQDDLKMSAVEADALVGQIYFVTLTHHLHENDTMKQAAQQLINTCDEILKPEVCKFVREAIQNVELDQ